MQRGAAAAALSILAVAGSPAPPDPAAAASIEEPAYIPAGVIDAGGTIACLQTPAGGVETIDTATGRSLWRTEGPARALLVARGQVFVLEERPRGSLRVTARPARPGRPVRTYALGTLALPAWASLAGSGEPREATRLEVAARLDADSLDIFHDATRTRISGMRPPAVADRVQGAARIALDSGRVEVRPGPPPAPPPLSEPAPPLAGVRPIAVHARRADAALMLGGPPPQIDGALVAGDRRFVFELSPDAKSVIVHRRRGDGGTREPPLRIEHGHATDAIWVTLDRRHLLLRRAYAQQQYDLYALDTGAPIGMLERPVDAAVIGSRIYWTTVQPDGRLVLTATGAGTGRRLWRRTVREADRRPPGPPIP